MKILVANRGEVAVRVARSVRDLGHVPVGVFAADDRLSPHLAAMAQAEALPGEGAGAYLDVAQLVAAARNAGAGALHPGWGFASEQPALAEACKAAGIMFIGPDARLLALFGDKQAARAAAAQAGLPVAEAAEDLAGVQRLLKAGPVMIKARAGGGGRGMRVVGQADALAESWAQASAEALASFGDGRVFAERLIEGARHVEVQILGDGSHAVSLGSRDCTLQRRQQKLIETAPAPDTAELEALACRMAAGLGYRGLGTWEFLRKGRETWFLEVNPRLQVEHTVTEAVTGLDLVALQIGVCMGRDLAALGVAVAPAPRGFSLQLRINAETMLASGAVLPAAGVLAQFAPSSGPGVRVDHAAAPGMALNPAYDSLLAKLVVHAPDRAAALARAVRALAEFRIEGVDTNLGVLARILALPAMQADALHTGLLGELAAEIGEQAEPAGVGQGGEIRAPMPGVLVALAVVPGELVRAGQNVALIEAMKMQMAVPAPCAGRVRAVLARQGQSLAMGAVVMLIDPVEGEAEEAALAGEEAGAIRADLQALLDRLATTTDAGRPEAVGRRHAKGKRMARENLADLFDPDSFIEYGALAVAAQRRRRSMEELIRISPADGLVTGIGSVAGTPTAAMAYDYTVMAGTQGFLNHKKTDRLLDLVHQDRLPLVLFAEGGGGRPGDTDVMGVAGLDLTSFARFAGLSGKVPVLGIGSGHCFAGNAAMLGVCDTIIATADASIGMGGPAMIEGGGLGVFRPEEVGPVGVQWPNGVIDLLAADEAEAVRLARQYLGYFSAATAAWSSADPLGLRGCVPPERKRIYDMRALIMALADTGSVLELRAGFGLGMITALLRIEGRAMGLIANNPAHLGGAIDADAADKAARFLNLCDAHGLPVLSLCDTPGFMVGPEVERLAQVRHVSRMFVQGAALRVPVFCVVTRKGYGLGAMAMAAGGFHQPRFTIAWPSGEFGGMGLEGAVRLGYRRELEAEADPAARAALFERLVGRLYAEGQAMNMASYLEIDAVIDPAETRSWIARGLKSCRFGGSGRMIDTW